jgi:hypothetical protein
VQKTKGNKGEIKREKGKREKGKGNANAYLAKKVCLVLESVAGSEQRNVA